MAEVLEKQVLDLLGLREELVRRLTSLEEMKTQTNERVYWRIREDYSAQLQDVLEQINQQRGSLESKARELAEQISDRESTHQQQADKVDELRIRADLGEFDKGNEEYKKELSEAESSRDRTAGQLNKLKKELEDLNGVLKDVDEATAAGVPGGPPTRPAEAAMEEPEVGEEVLEEVGQEEIEEIEELDLEEDELEEISETEENKCPSCGHVNPPHLVVCEECNAELEDLGQDLDDEFDFDDVDVDL